MKNLFVIFVFILLTGCYSTRRSGHLRVERHLGPRDYAIYFDGDNDGRPMYTVVFSDGKAWESVYPEEIAKFLKTGIVEYDETLGED